jgi:large subunit ribosomal protein L37Ae
VSKRTQKTGATARFGSRYGVSVRRRAGIAIAKVKRKASGIWGCRKCGHTFAGGVWEPFTRASDTNNRIIRRGLEGATATDMAVIASQKAIEYERSQAEAAERGDEEE